MGRAMLCHTFKQIALSATRFDNAPHSRKVHEPHTHFDFFVTDVHLKWQGPVI